MKKKFVLISIAIIIALVIVLLLFMFFRSNKEELFICSYKNYNYNYGYIIYSDGTIKEYDEYNHKKNLKKENITNEELAELKELANKVKDEYKEKDTIHWPDMGGYTEKIYNSQSKKWIILDSSDVSNNSEEGQKIEKLIAELYQKYLNQ